MSQFRRKIGRKLVVCTQVLWCALLSYQSDCLVCQNETKKHGHLKLEINFYLVCLVLTERFSKTKRKVILFLLDRRRICCILSVMAILLIGHI